MFIYLSKKSDEYGKKDVRQKNILIDIYSIISIKASDENAPENGSDVLIETETVEDSIEVFETIKEIAQKLEDTNELIS